MSERSDPYPINATKWRLHAYRAMGARYVVVVEHDHTKIAGKRGVKRYKRGDLISWHMGHRRAAYAAGGDPWLTVMHIDDAIKLASGPSKRPPPDVDQGDALEP